MSNNCTLGASRRTCDFIYVSYDVVRLSFILPLSIFILSQAFHQWKQQRSFKSSSHFDIFTYNVSVLELIFTVGVVFYFLWLCLCLNVLYTVARVCFMMTLIGEFLFHVLTCVERYMAVVHPVTYRELKNIQGVGIRNALIVCVWIQTFLWCSCHLWAPSHLAMVPFVCIMILSLIIVSVASFSALCVLLRPGPGEVGGARERVNQAKKRAFFIMMVITVVLWVGFLGVLGPIAAQHFNLSGEVDFCLMKASGLWFHMPIGLVLPLLYLHRRGKLACCCQKTEEETSSVTTVDHIDHQTTMKTSLCENQLGVTPSSNNLYNSTCLV